MKRVLPLLLCLALSASSVLAQVLYFEDFESGWPEGYTLVNVDGLTPDDPDLIGLADSAWSIRYISQGAWNSNGAFSVSWYENDEGPSDDWMILPAIELGGNSQISWTGMAITSSGNFRDRYQVAISTAGTELDDFFENPLLFDTGAIGEEVTPQNRSLNLAAAGYANQVVYIAFRNFTAGYNPDLPVGNGNGGNELMIDNIQIEELPVSTRENSGSALELAVSPNPASQRAQLQFFLPTATEVQVLVYDLQGRLMQNLQAGYLAQGAQSYELNTGSLPAGLYLVQVQAAQLQSTLKLQVK